jgi:hypothetical protein
MALPQSAVSELLEAFCAGDGVDLVRESVRIVMQEPIEAEARSRPRLLATQAGDWSCGSPSSGRGRSSR